MVSIYRRTRARDFLGASYWYKLKPHTQGLRRMLGLLDHALHRSIAVRMWMPEDSYVRVLWHDLTEQL